MIRPLRLVVFAAFLSSAPALLADDAIPEPTQRTDAPFRLFRTLNIFNFLKLGSAQADQRLVNVINSKPLADGKMAGRFTLYPSSNIFTFILLGHRG
jgi:hypothetical protein